MPNKCQVCGQLGPDALCCDCILKIKFVNEVKNNIQCVTLYEGVMKKAIKRFKFRRKKALAVPLGKMMAKIITFKCLDLVIPVPLHINRFKERGFNQSALLAGEIGTEISVPVLEDVLIRQKETLHQFDLKKHERKQNVSGAFRVTDISLVKGKKILLVDDIYTTGSTVRECARCLNERGAKIVYIACLSRASDI